MTCLKWGRFILLFVVLIAVLTAVGYAQRADFNLTTSPLPITLSVSPGNPVSTDLRIKNTASQMERLKVNLYKFNVTETGEVKLLERETGDSYFDWVSFSETEFTAAPGEWKTIKMTVTTPKDAALGYYFAVSFSHAAETEAQPGTATLEGQVITFVLLEVVVPGAKKQLEVTEFSTDKAVYEYLPNKLSIKVKNTGNIHVSPYGNIFIMRGKKTIGTLNFNTAQGNVLPASQRIFQTDWEDGWPVYKTKVENDRVVLDKDGQTKRELNWDFSKVNKLRIGKYTAKLVLVYNDGRRDIPVEAVVSFWVIPWRILLVALFIAVFVGIGLYSTIKKLWRKARKSKYGKTF